MVAGHDETLEEGPTFEHIGARQFAGLDFMLGMLVQQQFRVASWIAILLNI